MHPTSIELLQDMPVFGAIRDDALNFLLALAREIEVPAGQYFFRENDPANSMFVLERGAAEVIKGWQGHDTVLHRLGAGDCFGEMALIDGAARAATARAKTACEVAPITEKSFLFLVHETPFFAIAVMRALAERLRRSPP